MPLKVGTSKKTFESNISELMHGKKHKAGKMTISQAVAIAYEQKRKAEKMKGK